MHFSIEKLVFIVEECVKSKYTVRDSFSETGRLFVRHPVLFSLKKTR